jgi:hypothetical protein
VANIAITHKAKAPSRASIAYGDWIRFPPLLSRWETIKVRAQEWAWERIKVMVTRRNPQSAFCNTFTVRVCLLALSTLQLFTIVTA